MSEQQQSEAAQYQQISKNFKAIIEAITTYQFAQLKLFFSNLQKRIQQKKDQFHSQYGNITDLLNQTKEAKGKVPLHFACAKGEVNTVRYMIQQLKTDYNIKDKQGNNMFFTALEHGHLQLVRYFIEELNVSANSTKEGQINAMHVAANRNNIALIEYLHSKKTDIEKVSIYGKPINWAVGSQNVQATLKLLQLGANPDGDLTAPAPPPLILAIDFNAQQIYNALIKYKCSLDVTDPDGYTPLHLAAEKGEIKIVKDLIQRGLSKYINTEVNGKTPLYLAFLKNQWQVVNYLSEHTHEAHKTQEKVEQEKAKLAQNNPQSKVVTEEDKKQAQNMKNQGNKLYGQKKYTEALQFYQKAHNIDPKNEIIDRNLAACYLGLQRYQQALESCQRAKRNNQKNVKTLYRQAQAYIGLKNYIQGSSSLWQCVALQPKNAHFMAQFKKVVQLAKQQHKQQHDKKP